MNEPLKLTIEEPARFSISTLGPESRRLVEGWLESIRHWHDDPFARARSVRLKDDEELYVFRTNMSDMMIAFRIAGDEVVVQAILSKEVARLFEAASNGTRP